MTKFLNISTDNTLGGSSASDETVSSQKAIKEYIDSKAPEIDGISITQNSNDELQTIGVIDQNNTSNAIKTWSGTKAQYNAITTKDSNTLYNITDDATTQLSAHNLFDFKWADHELNDQSWLRADTFSWQDGTFYDDAYNHLVDDWNNWWATHQQSEMTHDVIDGQEVWCITASDGHKIAYVDEVTSGRIDGMYNATGVAWYYILDTTNQRFKLPRTKYGFTGLRDTVGKYVPHGLPNIAGNLLTSRGLSDGYSGAFYSDGTLTGSLSSTSSGSSKNVKFSAAKSNSIYGNSSTVQPRATQMYLYFYVGQFSQSATEQTAGLNSELFNGKVDLNLNNINNTNNVAANNLNSKGIRTVITSYRSGTSWYRIYSDGWVEQGGTFTSSDTEQNKTVNLLKTMDNTNYFISLQRIKDNYSDNSRYSVVRAKGTSSFRCYGLSSSTCWEVKGFGA